MSYPTAKLRDIAPPETSRTTLGQRGKVWLLNLDQIEKDTGRILSHQFTDAEEASASTAEFDTRHVLYSKLRPNLNKVVCPDQPGYATTELVRLVPDQNRVLREYLTYYLRSNYFVDFATRCVAGAKMPRMVMDEFWHHEMPTPSSRLEQRRIVELLKTADDLRYDASRVGNRLEIACDPIFRHCFGENFPHESNLQREALHQVADVVSGVTKGRALNDSEIRTVAYMRVANVQDGHIALDDVKTIEATDQEIAQYALQRSDILLTEGGDPDKLGRGAIWDASITPCIHQNHIFRVRITTDELLPEYLSALFSSAYGKSYFLRMAKQTTGIASMNIGQLKQFPVVMARRDQQIEFKRLQAQFDEIKARLAKQAATLETLFQTLLQRAFDGRLTAKWREAHAKELLEEMHLQSRA